MFVRGTKVSLGDIWSNDISQVSRGLMDYNFVAQKNNFIDNSFIIQVTSAGVSTWA